MRAPGEAAGRGRAAWRRRPRGASEGTGAQPHPPARHEGCATSAAPSGATLPRAVHFPASAGIGIGSLGLAPSRRDAVPEKYPTGREPEEGVVVPPPPAAQGDPGPHLCRYPGGAGKSAARAGGPWTSTALRFAKVWEQGICDSPGLCPLSEGATRGATKDSEHSPLAARGVCKVPRRHLGGASHTEQMGGLIFSLSCPSVR